jgi:hypothetical protein
MEAVECRYGVGDKSRVIGWLGPGPDGNLRYLRCASKGASSATLAAIKFQDWAIRRLGIKNVEFRLKVPFHD